METDIHYAFNNDKNISDAEIFYTQMNKLNRILFLAIHILLQIILLLFDIERICYI